MAGPSKIVCQAIVSPQLGRRMVWAVVPKGCVLSNSVSFLDLPHSVVEVLIERFGSLDEGLEFLASKLNSSDLDLWSRAWAANNNVNNYEIEMLPFDAEVGGSSFSMVRKDEALN